MNVEAIAAVSPMAATAREWPTSPGLETTPSKTFESWMSSEVTTVDQRIREADAAVRSLASGDNVALHDVMLTIERAKLSFEFVVQVRNRLLEAYQDVMRMQI